MSKYGDMTGPELVDAYNAMAAKANVTPVKRFSNIHIGIKRCIELDRSLGGTVDTKPKEMLADTKSNEDATASTPKKPKAAKKEKPVKVKDGTLLGQFEARAGTIREKVVKLLLDNLDKQVSLEEILKSAYGKSDPENYGALTMVLKGVTVMITKHQIPLTLKRHREGREITYGLHKAE